MESGDLRVVRLRCEYLVNPLGIDETRPRLSWNIESDRRGARQTAWRVRVASSAEFWPGARLTCGTAAAWKTTARCISSTTGSRWSLAWPVTGRCRSGTSRGGPPYPSRRSGPWDCWRPSDWQAHWIAADPDYLARAEHAIKPTRTEPGTPPWFRKAFTIDGSVRRATLYASARGLFDLHLNGRA